jgi:alpha-D-xyloside xylohydrolase
MPGRTLTAMLSGMCAVLITAPASAQWTPSNPVTALERQPDGVLFTMKQGVLKIQVCTDRILHVVYSPSSSGPTRPNVVVAKTAWSATAWTLHDAADTVALVLPGLTVSVLRRDGRIIFSDTSGSALFTDHSRIMVPAVVNGESTYHVEVFSNLWGSPEAFYGLGGHQAGVWNYRGESVDISQDNTNISMPMFLSSNGYGIFWNNTSRSRFNNRFPNALYLTAEVADAVDYYFLYGPGFDTIITGYRALTGDVPMFGKWAYGFWQCKNRYASQAELLEVARTYRRLNIPIDNIVQDWFWWNTMGEPVFDASRYPDPRAMVDELHKRHFHLMISFWPYFRPGTRTYEEMGRLGFFVDTTKVAGFHPSGQALYDAFNPAARKYYWNLMDTALFRIGVDAWWLDTTEPETEGRETNILVTNTVAMGNGARYVNLYPLMTTTGVYEGQRSATDRKRVFILSRSAWAGSQRTATAVWSGDVNSDWVAFKRQIPSGLNYALSGLPYWTTDIGGFLLGHPDDPAYRELFVRWFQFGAFTPILRVHGTRSPNQNELWSYGPAAQTILVNTVRLRYRLLPYIYSLAWMTTRGDYTPMRPLVMDFRRDVRAANIGDQFMYGPAILVSPVTEPGAGMRRVYLPRATWYDFWTGRRVEGGKAIDVEAPLDRLPLFVRAGSLIPLGPDLEWTAEKPPDPIELRIYRGADGDFTLYEDEGDSYDYEKGAYATIKFYWDDARQVLNIGERKGGFPGMLDCREFRIVFVSERAGRGSGAAEPVGKSIRYCGKAIVVLP